MYLMFMAFIVLPLVAVIGGLHHIGKKAIANGEFDARGRRIVKPAPADVDAEFGRMVRRECLADAATVPTAASRMLVDPPTEPIDAVDGLAGLDLPADVIEQIEQAVAERVTPWLEAAYEDGVRAGVRGV